MLLITIKFKRKEKVFPSALDTGAVKLKRNSQLLKQNLNISFCINTFVLKDNYEQV